MIRWQEDTECYRLEVTRPLQAASLVLLGGGALMGSLVVAVFGLEKAHFDSLVWTADVLLIAMSAGALWMALGVLRRTAFVEIAVRGGRARWGGERSDPWSGFAAIAGFHAVRRPWGLAGIYARLPDGRSVRVLGPMSYFSIAQPDRLVRQMNEYVGAAPPPQRSLRRPAP